MSALSYESLSDSSDQQIYADDLAADSVIREALEDAGLIDETDLDDHFHAVGKPNGPWETPVVGEKPRKLSLADYKKPEESALLYFGDVRRVPLLDRQREVELAKKIETGKLAHRRLFTEEIESDDERQELAHLVEEAKDARSEFWQSNLRLVISIAKKYRHSGVPILDLIQEGNIGLERAVDKFDWRRGFKFSTLATLWVTQAVERSVPKQSRVIQLPEWLTDGIYEMPKRTAALAAQLGRLPTSIELGDDMQLSPEQIKEIKRYGHSIMYLDQKIQPNDPDSPAAIDHVRPTGGDVSVEATRYLFREVLEEMLKALNDREREVLGLLYPMDGKHDRTQEEVGNHLGVSRGYISRVRTSAFNKLRELGLDPNLLD